MLKGLEGFASGGVMKATPKKSRSMRSGAVDRNPARRTLLGQIEHHRGRSDDVSLAEVVAHCHALQTAMRNTLSLEIEPSRMRSYVPHELDHLGTGGHHLSAVLRRLCQEADHKNDLLGWLRAIFAPEIAELDFVETDLGDVMMVIVEKDGTRIPAQSLPDGALRVFGKLIGVLTAPEGSLVLLEEIEAGLHPDRAGTVAQILESATRPGTCQVLATTYSPPVLQAMSKQVLGHAVVFERDPGTSGTVARRLGDLPRFAELAERSPGSLLSPRALAAASAGEAQGG
jgi:predicted ATPase